MTARRALLALVTALWVLPIAAFAADFAVPPTPNHFVTDNAGALSDATRARVESELQSYERATGHQVIVWIGQSTGDVPLETYTAQSAHEWKIGRKGHDDGAVLFLFMRDHKVRIEVGYGLEGSLTDADSKRIIDDDIVPRMKAGDADGAVSGGVAAMIKTITPAYAGVTPPPEQSASPAGAGVAIAMVLIVGTILLIVIVTIVVQVLRSARYGYLVMREGPAKAKADMKNWGGSSGGFIGAMASGGGDDSSSSSDDDFDAGGGDFGGGGASGSW